MTRSEAIEAIRSSIARGSATPTLGTDDRAAYIHKNTQDLEAIVIEPVAATVHGVAYEHGLLALLKSDPALVIAHRGNNWLGFVPSLGQFFLAYGTDPGALNALGFYSDDALAEWMG